MGLAIAACWPSYTRIPIRAREAALREDLSVLRQRIQQYYQDRGQYPVSLQVLNAEHYIRKVPIDSFTRSGATWRLIRAPGSTNVVSVRSGFHGTASDGSQYESW